MDPGDKRIEWLDGAVVSRLTPGPLLKYGTHSPFGVLAYISDGVVFRKRFSPVQDLHADNGCNVEVYADADSAEFETLGPLAALQPGKSCVHKELWEFEPFSGDLFDIALLRSAALGGLERPIEDGETNGG